MKINYSKRTMISIIRSIGYFALWGIAFELVLFLILWYLTKWDFKQLLINPYMAPFTGLKIWLIIGAIHGWLNRNKKPRAMTLKRWGRQFLYMLVFGSFVMSLQLYYVHRKNTGYYDLADASCLNKYQSFWLITDKIFYKNTDDCLRSLKQAERNASGEPTYTYIPFIYNHDGNYKGEFIDYDVITPRVLWILIAFIIITIIELFRRYGPMGLYKGIKNYGRYFQVNIIKMNRRYYEIIFFGALVNLVFLILLPKINGYPSRHLPLILFLAAGFYTLRVFFSKKLQTQKSGKKIPDLFVFVIGIALSSLILTVLGLKALYYILFICLSIFLILFRKVSIAKVTPLILFFILLDPDFLFADDGTWTEGGLDRLAADSAGPMSIGNVEDLAETTAVTVPLYELEGDEDAEDEESLINDMSQNA